MLEAGEGRYSLAPEACPELRKEDIEECRIKGKVREYTAEVRWSLYDLVGLV